MYNGRILVIDSQYTIVKDTYATLNGMNVDFPGNDQSHER